MANFTRRDILHTAALIPGMAGFAHSARGALIEYPPAKTGMRGSHEGSYEVAHALAWQGQTDFGPVVDPDEQYDLMVVGGGISGLAAAYFYRQKDANAKILILDNHDDFGGHAKRNEFVVDGRTLIGYGGSQTLESPSAYSDVAKELLRALQVELDVFDAAYNQDFYTDHKLQGGLFFDQEGYGRSVFVPLNLFGTDGFLGLSASQLSLDTLIQQVPLEPADKAQLHSLLTQSGDALPDVSLFDLPEYLHGISYKQFLQQDLGITSNAVLNVLQHIPSGYFGIGIDGITALEALATGMPGGKQLGVAGFEWLRDLLGGLADPYIHHFPDGNASIARLLVRSLIPEMAPSADPQALLLHRFDYNKLDNAAHNVRIRLNSTAVNVTQSRDTVDVIYVQAGQSYKAKATHCVMACYNNIVPYLVPELPQVQKEALAQQVKVPLVYTNVVLRNWRALAKLKVGQCFAPNMFHKLMMMDFPVSMGNYRFSQTPNDPVVLHLSSAFGAPGLHPKEQFRIGRAALLGTGYEAIEADTFNFLTQLLGPGGFDVQRDVAAVTVNRWPHGYAYGSYVLFDNFEPGSAPHEIGRKRWGNVVIANSDAGARAYLDEAINQAHRAVSELI